MQNRKSLAILAFAGAVWSGRTEAQYTPQQQSAVASVIKSMTADAPLTLNPQDSTQMVFLQSQLPGINLSTDLPKTMSQLKASSPKAVPPSIKQGATPNQIQDIIDFTALGEDLASGALTADGLVSVYGGSSYTLAGISFIDMNTYQQIDSATLHSSTTGVDLVVSASGQAASAQKPAAILTMLVSPVACAPGADCAVRTSDVTYAQTVFLVVPPPSVPTVSIPTHTVTTVGHPIVVCLGRTQNGGTPANCDYWDSTQAASANPQMRFPFQGFVKLARPIASVAPPQMYLQVLPSGGGCAQINATSPSAGLNAPAGAYMATWTLLNPINPYDGSQWAQFGALNPPTPGQGSCYTQGITKLFGQLNITDNTGQVVIAKFSSVPADKSAFTGTTVDSTYLAWGCVAAGTPVALPGGRSKPIEQIVVGDMVQSGPGGAKAKVLHTFIGREHKSMFRIADEAGGEALLTGDHPVLVGGAFKPAREVRVGDPVHSGSPKAAGGRAKVTRVDTVSAGRKAGTIVHNLRVDASGTRATFIAGGLVVGDHETQNRENNRRVHAALLSARKPAPGWEKDAATLGRIASVTKARQAAATKSEKPGKAGKQGKAGKAGGHDKAAKPAKPAKSDAAPK